MKTILSALTSNTVTIVVTLLVIAFLAYIYKNVIVNYIKHKFNLFDEKEVLTFLKNNKLTSGKSYNSLKTKIDLFKIQRKNVRK